MSEQEKKEKDKQQDTAKETNTSAGGDSGSKLEATGALSTPAAPTPGSARGVPGTLDSGFPWESFEKELAKHPEFFEQLLARHPTLVALEKLAAQLKETSGATARMQGNVPVGISATEADFWNELVRLRGAINEAKQKNEFQWKVASPLLTPPALGVGFGSEPLSEQLTGSQSFYAKFNKVLQALRNAPGYKVPAAYEASLTTGTSGAAMGVESATPVVVIPTAYPAQLRDTTIFGTLQQGVDRWRFSLISAYAMGALTEATEPTELTDALGTVDVLTTERGGEKKVSFPAQRKLLGPIDEGVVFAERLGELYDEDNIIFGGLGVSGISGLSDITTTGAGDGTLAHLAGLQYGDGTVASDGAITSTMTFKESYFAKAVQAISKKYGPDGIVAVMHNKVFSDLIEDSNIQRYMQWHYPQDTANALIAQGFIPNLHGVEIRRSSLTPTVSTTNSGTGYSTYFYKKNFSVAMAATQEVTIESFRNIQLRATVYTIHYQLGTNIVAPNSVYRFDTA